MCEWNLRLGILLQNQQQWFSQSDPFIDSNHHTKQGQQSSTDGIFKIPQQPQAQVKKLFSVEAVGQWEQFVFDL